MAIKLDFPELPRVVRDAIRDMGPCPNPLTDSDNYLLWAQAQSIERRAELRKLCTQLEEPERSRILKLLDENAPN